VKNYFAAITGIDEQFGRLMKCLKQEGLEENTIVVFTSDHGEMMGSHNRLEKFIYYEESIGIPFLIRWPKRIKPGREDILLSVPDIMPTILNAMGLENQIPNGLEGSDHSDVLFGKHGRKPESIPYIWPNARGVRTDRYTFLVERNKGVEETILFDNLKDKYQMKNIAGENPALVQELKNKTNAWMKYTSDPWGSLI
jgi:uncharacterized sulfatase